MIVQESLASHEGQLPQGVWEDEFAPELATISHWRQCDLVSIGRSEISVNRVIVTHERAIFPAQSAKVILHVCTRDFEKGPNGKLRATFTINWRGEQEGATINSDSIGICAFRDNNTFSAYPLKRAYGVSE